jgi:hypothetical protein
MLPCIVIRLVQVWLAGGLAWLKEKMTPMAALSKFILHMAGLWPKVSVLGMKLEHDAPF